MNSMGQRDPVTQSTTPLNASRFASRKAKSKKSWKSREFVSRH